MSKGRSDKTNIDRRAFVKRVTTVGLTAPLLDVPITANPVEFQQQQTQQANQRVTKEMLHAAEQLIGLDLNDAQETMALRGVNQNLSSYETLRKIDVPLDTEPAISFRPALPGKRFDAKPVKFKLTKQEIPKYNALDDVAFFKATQLAELVRTRQVSSLDLTKMYLSRLKRYGPRLLCVVTLTEDLALKQAAEADREIKAGKYRGPLHGIPCGIKDLFATKGIKTTWGAEPFRDQMIEYDATVVERLREAGAVLVAKLSMGALAQGGRWFAGMTRNPWQVDETLQGSSGSSAGPASATAAGLVGFSIGTETLGSIVSPATRCGCAGLRPTYGRVSRYGAMALSWTMDKIGPICRGVEDLAAVLSAINGPDQRDITVGDVPFNWLPETPLSKMRIGYLKAEFEAGTNENQKAMYKTALDVLRSAGANLEPIELPQFSAGSLNTILSAEAAAAFDDITRDGRVNQLSGQAPFDWPNSFRTSRFIPAVEYIRAQRARTLLMREMDKLMSKWDVFVSPTSRTASLLVTNLTGHPQVCVPCGFIDGLPRSMLFAGGLYDEASPLRVALAYENATNWHTMHPKMDWAR